MTRATILPPPDPRAAERGARIGRGKSFRPPPPDQSSVRRERLGRTSQRIPIPTVRPPKPTKE